MLVAALAAAPRAQAATLTWVGGGADNNWSTPANWSSGAVPGSADDVVFDGTANTNSSIDSSFGSTVNSISMNPGYTGTITLARSLTVSTSFSQADGTLDVGSQTLDINGAFTLSGGTFDANAGTVNVAGNFTLSGGTFNQGTSTFTFDGGVATLDVLVSQTFYNLTINGTKAVADGDTLIVTNTLTLANGSLNQTVIPAGGSVEAQAGVTHNTNFDGGTGLLIISGAAPRTINLVGGGEMPGVTLNAANVTLNGPPSGTTVFEGTTTSFTLQDGTVSGGVGALTVTFAYSQSGGAFSAGTGTMTVTRAFTLSGGTFDANAGGTVTLNGDVTILGGTYTAAGTTNIGNNSADTFSMTSGTFNAGGTVTVRATTNAISGGTFDGDAATLDVNAAFTLSGGTFILSSGSNTFAGNFTVAGTPIFTEGTSTLTFDGGNATLNVATSQTLYNLTINSTGTKTISSADTLIVTNTLTLTNGSINTGTIELQVADGSETLSIPTTFDGGTGVLLISGTAPWTFDKFGSQPMMGLTLNAANVTLLGPASGTTAFEGAVTIQAGTFDFAAGSAGSLTFNSTFAQSGGTFDGTSASGTMTVPGAYTLSGGAFTGLATTTLNGNVTISGGTFNSRITSTIGNTSGDTLSITGGTFNAAGTVTVKATTNAVSGGTFDAGSATVTFSAPITVSGGTLDGDGATLDVDGDFTLSAGTFILSSGSNLFSEDFTVSGTATIIEGTSTLNLDGGPLTGQTLGGTAAIGLYNLTISNSAGVTQTTTVAAGGTLDLGGPLTFIGQSLSIANPITGVPNNLAGDATSTLTITGTGSGIIIPSSLAALLNLSIDNPNGAALAGPLTVGGTFTLAGGNLVAGNDVLSIGPAGSVIRTSGHVVGALQKWVPLGSGVTVTYEIGDATIYAPVRLTFGTVGTTGQLTATTTPGEHPSIGASVLDPSQDVNRWWSLANLGTDFDVLAATFTFGPGDTDPGAQPGQFVVARWDGSWTLPALAGQTGTSITAAGITSLGAFAVGEVVVAPSSMPDVALPMRAPGGIRALSLAFSAWVLLLLTLAVVTARGQRRRW